jgi:hypothetical protein
MAKETKKPIKKEVEKPIEAKAMPEVVEKQPELTPIEDLRNDIKALAVKMRAVGKLQPSPRRFIAWALKLEALISRRVF